MSEGLERRQWVGGVHGLTVGDPDRPPVPAEGDREVLWPTSPEEAIAAFGDGAGVTVISGATVLLAQIARGTLRPSRVVMLGGAGMDGIEDDATTLTFGAGATLAAVADVAPEPLAAAARIPDGEIRAQATLGGNLHWPGDLHAPLLTLDARVRSAGDGGEREEPLETYLASARDRLVLSVSCRRPDAGVHLAQRRIHSATYTVLSVAVARHADRISVAVGGVGAHGVRCRAVEAALAERRAPQDAATAVHDDVTPVDDPLASGWYRSQVLPVLIARALARLERTT